MADYTVVWNGVSKCPLVNPPIHHKVMEHDTEASTCGTCGQPFMKNPLALQDICSGCKAAVKQDRCIECGAQLVGKQTRFCSRLCSGRYRNRTLESTGIIGVMPV